MDGCYTRNKSNTKRTTYATSLAVSAPTRKISPSTSTRKALENTSRRGHSQRQVQSQKYYLMVRYRCGVLNSLREKKQGSYYARVQYYIPKPSQKRQTPKEILLTDFSPPQQDDYQRQQTGSCQQQRIQKAVKKSA